MEVKVTFYLWVVDFITFIRAHVNLYEVYLLVRDVKLLEVMQNMAFTGFLADFVLLSGCECFYYLPLHHCCCCVCV